MHINYSEYAGQMLANSFKERFRHTVKSTEPYPVLQDGRHLQLVNMLHSSCSKISYQLYRSGKWSV